MDDFQRREKLRLEILENREEKEHFHQDIELIYVLSGKLELNIDGQKTEMSAEDVLMVNANKRHYLKSSGEIVYARLMIMYDMLSDVLNDFDLMCAIRREIRTPLMTGLENSSSSFSGIT